MTSIDKECEQILPDLYCLVEVFLRLLVEVGCRNERNLSRSSHALAPQPHVATRMGTDRSFSEMIALSQEMLVNIHRGVTLINGFVTFPRFCPFLVKKTSMDSRANPHPIVSPHP